MLLVFESLSLYLSIMYHTTDLSADRVTRSLPLYLPYPFAPLNHLLNIIIFFLHLTLPLPPLVLRLESRNDHPKALIIVINQRFGLRLLHLVSMRLGRQVSKHISLSTESGVDCASVDDAPVCLPPLDRKPGWEELLLRRLLREIMR